MRYRRSGKALALKSFTTSYVLGVLTCVMFQLGLNRYEVAFLVVLTLGCQVFGYLCLALLKEDMTVYDDTD